MYCPSLEEAKALSSQGNLVPIYREILADLETPVSAYLKVARGPSFLLESVEGGERLARYSFIGTEPYRIFHAPPAGRPGPDPLKEIERELAQFRLVPVPDLPPFHGGAVGYLAYDVATHFERLPSPESDPLELPQAIFLFTDTLLVFDHLKHKIKIVGHVRLDGDVEATYAEAVERIEALAARLKKPLKASAPKTIKGSRGGTVTSNISREEYEAKVVKAKGYVFGGDIIQVVPSQRLSRPTVAQPFDIYRSLRTVNPSPYMYYLDLGDCHLIGASPELLVRLEDGLVYNFPLAGTRPRGATPEADEALAQELLTDEKERAEHIMLLDLGRNDVGRVSQPGTVKVEEPLHIVRYSHVMHLESYVIGKIKPELSCFDALRACFPAGTVSGAPKIRAMEIIAELEPDKRGPYAGAVGYFGFGGNMDTAIAIRTIVFKDGVAHVQAGGGVVADSVPALEYQESLNKAQALLRAVDVAEAGLE
ncbi:MAG: anthranilate synthase component I [Chloroflexi bacterium]|nr:anthranilate synthase component I [Chloroflexota bacterium]